MTHELTDAEKLTANQMISVLQKAVEVPPPPPPPAMNYSTLSLIVYDVYVPAGDRLAYVPVGLNKPCNQTVVFKYLTQNETAIENNHFVRAEGYLVFQPGEMLKTVPVTLKKDLGTTKFKLTVGWPQNISAIAVADSTGRISGDPLVTTNPYSGPILIKPAGLLQRPANMTLLFNEDFTNFQASDSGYLADGVTPCWRTRMGHGRTQPGNQEMGYYADPVLNPGTTPYFVDAAGRLVLQSEYFPDGVPDENGQPIPCPWDAPNPFYYTSTIITTQRNFNTFRKGDFVEAKMTMCQQEGSWPAFWIMPVDYWSWPSIELDIFEGFFQNPGTLSQVGTTVHWKNESGGHSMFSLRLPQLGIDIGQPHVWGMHWGEKELTFFCDNVAYFAVPHVFPEKDCYLKFDITTGGLVGVNPDPAVNWPAQMPIEWVRVWR